MWSIGDSLTMGVANQTARDTRTEATAERHEVMVVWTKVVTEV